MWVWQSQAPAGISKFTGVDGCAALARTVRLFMVTPAAIEASIILRRVSIGVLPAIALLICLRQAGREPIGPGGSVLPGSPGVASPRPCGGDYRGTRAAGRATASALSFQ